MTSGEPTFYKLTVRPHGSDDGRFEYVLSRPGVDPVRSDVSYRTYEAAKEAGDALGRGLGLRASVSEADG